MHRGCFASVFACALVLLGCDGPPPSAGDAGPPDAGPRGPATFRIRMENVAREAAFAQSGVIGGADPIGPGESFEVELAAAPGMKLSFATMLVPSNDLFLAPSGAGIALFGADGAPTEGDVTDQLALWDLGTEENQEPGTGAQQPPRQGGPNTGPADPMPTVRAAADTFSNLPAVAEVVRATLTPTVEGGVTTFRLRLENVSTATTLATSGGAAQPVPLSPGVFVVHVADDPLFEVGAGDYGEGLEALAEDGAPAALAAALATETGITFRISPGMMAVAGEDLRLFTLGATDMGNGLESLAEDGDPGRLVSSFEGVTGAIYRSFRTAIDAAGPGPILPGQAYEIETTIEPGDRLHLVMMLQPSNDWFFSLPAEGLDPYDDNGAPITGDITDRLAIYDLGTEVDERVGFGLSQAGNQRDTDEGDDDPDSAIRAVTDPALPAASEILRVTLSVD